jgi:hypothetical protein
MFTIRFLAALVVLGGLAGLVARADEDHKGPNGGVLFEGAKHKFHIELKIDTDKKTLTAWILDGKAKKAVPIKAKTIQVKIKGESKPITLDAVPGKGSPGSFTQYRARNGRFGTKVDFSKVEVVAQVVEGKPAFTFKPED